MKRRRRFLAALATSVLMLGAVFASAPVAFAADGDVEIVKSASVATVSPGQSFTYTLTVTCTSLGAGCSGARVVDDVPSVFTVTAVAVGNGLQGDVTQNGQSIEVDFTEDLADGTQGIPGGATGTVSIQVQVADDLPYELNGVPIPNTATTDADTQTSGPLSDTAEVTPQIPLRLDTAVSKTLSPATAIAAPGTPVTATITASNESNAAIDTLTLVDPGDPPGTPNPFDTLPFTGIGTVTYPDGAETVTVEVWDGAAWQPYATGTAPDQPAVSTSVADGDVAGVRVVFADTDGADISASAGGGVEIGMEHGPDVASFDGSVTVSNTATSIVQRGGETASDTGTATHRIVADNIDLLATKSFSPDAVAAGETSTATITAGNQSVFPLTELTITEPALSEPPDPTADGLDDSMAFDGFTGPIDYPDGATGATVTYFYDDGTTEGPLGFADGTAPPPPSFGGDVARFSVTFSGSIAPGASTSVAFEVQTDPDQIGYPARITNTAAVSGTSPNGGSVTDEATDDLLVYEKHLEVITGKSIYPANPILDRPGEWVLVTLSGQVAAFPRSTQGASTIVVQDPAVPPASIDGTFWDLFDADSITQTAVPAGSTLTINYWNGTAWVPLLDENGDPVEVAGPTVFSMAIPEAEQDQILGLQFVYTADDGQPFPPGTTVEPHFTAEIRDVERDPATQTVAPAAVENCATSSAAGVDGFTSTPSEDDTACADTQLDPWNPDAGPEVLDKQIPEQTISARSQENARVLLNWSTGGVSGIQQVIIQDEAEPPTTAAVADSFWDAFDIRQVIAITETMDPHLRYDQVTAVQLWDGSVWRDLSNDPCPAACDGTFPGVVLTAADRDDALGIRLLIGESPTRAASSVGELTAPPVGSGVTRSSGNDRRVQINVRLRDVLRSDPSVPATAGLDYNVDDGDPSIGTVRDTARVTGTDSSGDPVIQTDDGDDILIIDVPLNVDLTKTWSNSPFGIPDDSVSPSDYPTGRVQLTATNRTAAKVDTLVITDPGPGAAENPFDMFDLFDIRVISVPTGATSTLVTLSRDTDGDAVADLDVDYTVPEALGLTSGELADVVGIVVRHDGRIDAGATAAVQLDLRLRRDERGTTDRVDIADGPVVNEAHALVDDAGGGTTGEPAIDRATATATFQDLDIDVVAGKSFTPDTQTEPDDAPVTMTLTAQPDVAAARVQAMVVQDSSDTFWNAFDFVGIDPSFTLAAPINRVEMDVLTGQTFEAVGDQLITTGGTWVEGDIATLADFLADPLPAGVQPADVQGVRFLFASDDGTGTYVQWENPIDPLQEIPVLVQRRADLRSGGEVPSDRADLSPAPGEASAGTFTNDSIVAVCTFLAETCELDSPGVALAFAVDQMSYLHAESGVQVTKTPTGFFVPGEPIPYTITVTNTGDWPIENPVIVDSPGLDDRLVLNPEPAGALYSFDLSGAAPSPATGLPLPTGDDAVTPTIADDPESYTFAFPEGTVLEVGQTYTITIDMVFAPGAPGLVPIDNTATVSGDRPLDRCNGVTGITTECSATTEVTPELAGAVRSQKVVRAVDDSLGAFDFRTRDPDGCDAPNALQAIDPAAEGFYWYPCVPRSQPGGEVEWRFGVRNTGNIPLDRMVMVDRLPRPGDTGVISAADRGSQWTPLLDPGTLELVDAPAGAVATFFVTTGTPCTDQMNTPGPPGSPVDACPPGAWVDPASVADPSTITAIMAVVDMPDAPAQPGETLLIDGRTTTPWVSETAGDDTIAFNSVAVGAHTTQAQSIDSGSQNMRPSEGTRVGAALATGDIVITKSVSGEGAQFAPDSFVVDVSCQSGPETIDAVATVTVGIPETVTGLPWGSTCTLSETAQGQVDYTVTPDSVTAGTAGEGGAGRIEIDNVFSLAGLQISKEVDSDAVDAAGNPIRYGTFRVSVTCTFLGEAVFADGWGPGRPMAFPLADAQSGVLDGLPAGSQCIVTETDVNGAAGTTIASETADGVVDAAPGTTTTVILTPDEDGQLTNTVDIVNSYGVGGIVVEKVLDPVDSPFAEGPFTAQVTCVLGAITTWDGEIAIDAGAPGEIADVAAGSTCTVVETDDGNATGVVVDPASVEVPLGGTVTVSVTNAYAEGSLTVTKQFDGDALWAADSFEVALVCVDATSAAIIVTIPGGARRTLTADTDPAWTATYDRLPAGAECLLWETQTGGAAFSDVIDADGDPVQGFFPIEAGSDLALSVVNTYEVGSIEVTKAVSGEGSGYWDGETFTVRIECTYDGAPLPDDQIPGGAERTFAAGDTVTFERLPPGASCTVSEPDDGGASAVTIDPDPVIVSPDDLDGGTTSQLVTVDNRLDVGRIIVEKEVAPGLGARWALGEFEVALQCEWNGAPVTVPGGATRVLSVAGGLTASYDGLPDGAVCDLDETDPANASTVTISPDGGRAIVVDAGQPVTLTVVNMYDTGAIRVVKTVEGPGAELGGDTAFEVALSCTWDLQGRTVVLDPELYVGGATRSLDAGNGYEAIYLGLPLDAHCTIDETYDGGAGEVTVTYGGDPEAEYATVGDGVPAAVSVVNVFDSAPIELTKIVDGPGAGYFGQGTFTLRVVCTLPDGDVVPRLVYDGDVAIAAGETVVLEGIPTGSVCRVTEPDDGVADSHAIAGSPVIVGASTDEVTATVTVTNTFLTGSVRVDKVVTGGAAAERGVGPFEVTIQCIDPDGGLTLVDIPGGASRTLSPANGLTTSYPELPAGAICGIAETEDGGADGQRLIAEDGTEVELVSLEGGRTAGFFAVEAGVELAFTLENRYDPPIPATGGEPAVVLIVGVLGGGLVGGGYLLVRSRRRTR